jgi:hypothetical protein
MHRPTYLLVGKPEGKNYLDKLCIDGRSVLKYILCIRREDVFVRLRESQRARLCKHGMTFRASERREISLFAKRILSFEHRICSLELVKMILLLIFTSIESFRRISGSCMFPNCYQNIQKHLGFYSNMVMGLEYKKYEEKR